MRHPAVSASYGNVMPVAADRVDAVATVEPAAPVEVSRICVIAYVQQVIDVSDVISVCRPVIASSDVVATLRETGFAVVLVEIERIV